MTPFYLEYEKERTYVLFVQIRELDTVYPMSICTSLAVEILVNTYVRSIGMYGTLKKKKLLEKYFVRYGTVNTISLFITLESMSLFFDKKTKDKE